MLCVGHRSFQPDQYPLVMAIVNVTPDSFSNVPTTDPQEAVDGAEAALADGADIVDVGPESTRPGSQPVEAEEQIRRARPVIERVHRLHPDALISIDTRLAAVAREAIAAGAVMINDTSAFRDDPEMIDVVAQSQATIVLMHRRGTPADMQAGGGPRYADLIGEIMDFLAQRAELARKRGIAPERIVLDPGIGFGKRTEHNLEILRRLSEFAALGYPLLIGASRKRFIGEITGVQEPAERLAGSLACALIAAQRGAAILRVHDVQATSQVLAMRRAMT